VSAIVLISVKSLVDRNDNNPIVAIRSIPVLKAHKKEKKAMEDN
jgi:hypothetical protein